MLCDVDYDEVIKSVFINSNVKSSSDIIFVLYKTGSRIDQELMLRLQPIYEIETGNWCSDVDSNIKYSFEKIDSLDLNCREEAFTSYNYLIKLLDLNRSFYDYYVADHSRSNLVEVISKIRQELFTKRDYCI